MSTDDRTAGDGPISFEDEVRAMLERRAAAVAPSPAARRRTRMLLTQPRALDDPAPDALVIPLSGRGSGLRPSLRERVVPAAAGLVLMAAAAGLIMAAAPHETTTIRPAQPSSPDASSVISPDPDPVGEGALVFDPATAEPIYEEHQQFEDSSVDGVVQRFVDTRIDREAVPLALDAAEVKGDLAAARWETWPDDTARRSGRIYLRRADGAWAVVGATTDQFAITGVQLEQRSVAVGLRWRGDETPGAVRLRVSHDDLLGEAVIPVALLAERHGTEAVTIALDGNLPPERPVHFSAAQQDREQILSITEFWVEP